MFLCERISIDISHCRNAGSTCPTALSANDNEQASPLRSCSREFDTHLSHVGSLFKDAFGGPAPASFPQGKRGKPRVAMRKVCQQKRSDLVLRTPTASAYRLAEGGLSLSGAFRTRSVLSELHLTPPRRRHSFYATAVYSTLDDTIRCLEIGYLSSGRTQGFRPFPDRRRQTAIVWLPCVLLVTKEGQPSTLQ